MRRPALRDHSLNAARRRATCAQPTSLSKLLEAAVDVVIHLDADGRCSWMSDGARRRFAGRAETFNLAAAFGPTGRAFLKAILAEAAESAAWQGELVMTGSDGAVHLDARLVPDRRADDVVDGWVLVGHDITAFKLLQADLAHRATHDPLTGVPNRALLAERLDVLLAARHPVEVVYLDLESFKAINDTRGHDAGDQALIEIASRLQRAVQGGGMVARVGGDEFVVLPPAEWNDAVEELRQRVFAEPIVLDGEQLTVGARLGAVTSLATESGHDVIVRADRRMYQSRRAA